MKPGYVEADIGTELRSGSCRGEVLLSIHVFGHAARQTASLAASSFHGRLSKSSAQRGRMLVEASSNTDLFFAGCEERRTDFGQMIVKRTTMCVKEMAQAFYSWERD